MFSEGRKDVNDEERAGRPSTSTTDEKINEVEKMILANRRITVGEVAEDLNISIGSCHSIFINDLGMRRVAAKFVPKLLNCDQKQHRMNIANEMLDSVRDDPNLLQRVITGDEACVYGYDVETKAQSSQWKLPHEPRPGVVHHEFLPQGRTVNKEYYLQVMRNLREAIRQKRPDLWKNKNWLLHHDNAPAHTSLLVRDILAKNNTLMMPQPPYSPHLAPFVVVDGNSKKVEADHGRRQVEPRAPRMPTSRIGMLQKAFKDDCISRSQSVKWHKAFKEGREEVADEPRSGRPTTARTDENVDRVLEVLRTDRRLSIQKIADTLHMSTFVVHGIVTEDLQMRKAELCMAQKSSPRPKKARMSKSRSKTMIIVFFDIRGVEHCEFVPQGQTVNSAFYLEVLRRLKRRIARVRTDIKDTVKLHHDNANSHTAFIITNFLARSNTPVIPHPSYSPDLAPCDFFLLPRLKREMKGKYWETVENIQQHVTTFLRSIPVEEFQGAFQAWQTRLRNYISGGGGGEKSDHTSLRSPLDPWNIRPNSG
ncbi:hypothetical protein LAZ67_5003465 [Cordylochernes scorpioides]|uniref:Transposase n=1 Tax=Cordylochernes scorpioides TaxID=51811 RepID=A0ABY6KHA9_9ARAC|nr:hypothetical protein LAZ67_5003465 [Cordylochernes scorpioides]